MAWDTAFEASPAGSDAPSTLDNKIREVKTEVRPRMDHEHLWLDTTTATGGYHRAGAAKVYFTTAAPTNRPDGSVALDSGDKGRLWFKSSTGSGVMVHNGTSFVSTGVTLSTSQTICGIKTFNTVIGMLTTSIYTTTGLSNPKIVFGVLSTLVPNVGDCAHMAGGWYLSSGAARGITVASRIRRTSAGMVRVTGCTYQITLSAGLVKTVTGNGASALTVKNSTGSFGNAALGLTLIW